MSVAVALAAEIALASAWLWYRAGIRGLLVGLGALLFVVALELLVRAL